MAGARQFKENVAIELHQSRDPLAEGTQNKGEVCSSVGNGGVPIEIDRHSTFGHDQMFVYRDAFAKHRFDGHVLPGLKIVGDIQDDAFKPHVISSVLFDAKNSIIERRVSTITDQWTSNGNIDTQIFDRGGHLKGTMHSHLGGTEDPGHVSTTVKDASGKVVRVLDSNYTNHIFENDQFCTHLKK